MFEAFLIFKIKYKWGTAGNANKNNLKVAERKKS